jgi:hypothetical protein
VTEHVVLREGNEAILVKIKKIEGNLRFTAAQHEGR